jgi:hypothetical protein
MLTLISELRWLTLTIFGLSLYSFSIWYLEKKNSIDFFKVFDISDHRKYVQFLLLLLASIDAFLFLFYNFVYNDFKILSFIIPIIAILLPFKKYAVERKGLIQTFVRLLFPKSTLPTPQIQIVFADILTSYAKILADWDLLFFCSILNRFNGPSSLCLIPGLLSVGLVCFPYFCRARQCLHDLKFQDNHSEQLLIVVNLLKYASSFPVIYFSYLLIWNKQGWTTTWVIVNLINYLLSTAWDLLVDWKLLHRKSSPQYKLQKSLIYSIALCNIIIRGVWSIRIVNQKVSDSYFTLICISEIARRFMWLLVRCDSIFCQQTYQPIFTRSTISPLNK